MGRRYGASRAFTLIELLIVIAIIAILALIAVPNFLTAHTRAKVARVQSDMRSIATALESYFVDYNAYPLRKTEGVGAFHPWVFEWSLLQNCVEGTTRENGVISLTTPVAYLTGPLPRDPFSMRPGSDPSINDECWDYSYWYYNFQGAAGARRLAGTAWDPIWAPVEAPAPVRFNGPGGRIRHANWALMSPGPDLRTRTEDAATQSRHFISQAVRGWDNMVLGNCSVYDPSNGVVSDGDLWRLDSPTE